MKKPFVKNVIQHIIRSVSSIVCTVFLFTTVAWSAPDGGRAAVSMITKETLAPQTEENVSGHFHSSVVESAERAYKSIQWPEQEISVERLEGDSETTVSVDGMQEIVTGSSPSLNRSFVTPFVKRVQTFLYALRNHGLRLMRNAVVVGFLLFSPCMAGVAVAQNTVRSIPHMVAFDSVVYSNYIETIIQDLDNTQYPEEYLRLLRNNTEPQFYKSLEEVLLKDFPNYSSANRLLAFSLLEKIESTEITEDIVECLTSSIKELRDAAARFIRSVAGEKAQKALEPFLLEKDKEECIDALALYIELHDGAEFGNSITDLLADESSVIRGVIADALYEKGWEPDTDTVAVYFAIARKDWDQCVRLGPLAMPILTTMFSKEYWEAHEIVQRAYIVSALGYFPHDGALTFLLENLFHEDALCAQAAYKSVVRHGVFALPQIKKLYASERKSSKRKVYAALIAEITGGKSEAMYVILDDENVDVVLTAIESLGAEHYEYTSPYLVDAYKESIGTFTGNSVTRARVMKIYGDLGGADTSVVIDYESAFDSDNEEAQLEAIRTAGKLQHHGYNNKVQEYLNHDDQKMRSAAVTTLDACGWKPETLIDTVHYALATEAWDAISALGKDALSVLIGNYILKTDSVLRNGIEQSGSAIFMDAFSHEDIKAVRKFSRHGEAFVRKCAFEKLGDIGEVRDGRTLYRVSKNRIRFQDDERHVASAAYEKIKERYPAEMWEQHEQSWFTRHARGIRNSAIIGILIIIGAFLFVRFGLEGVVHAIARKRVSEKKDSPQGDRRFLKLTARDWGDLDISYNSDIPKRDSIRSYLTILVENRDWFFIGVTPLLTLGMVMSMFYAFNATFWHYGGFAIVLTVLVAFVWVAIHFLAELSASGNLGDGRKKVEDRLWYGYAWFSWPYKINITFVMSLIAMNHITSWWVAGGLFAGIVTFTILLSTRVFGIIVNALYDYPMQLIKAGKYKIQQYSALRKQFIESPFPDKRSFVIWTAYEKKKKVPFLDTALRDFLKSVDEQEKKDMYARIFIDLIVGSVSEKERHVAHALLDTCTFLIGESSENLFNEDMATKVLLSGYSLQNLFNVMSDIEDQQCAERIFIAIKKRLGGDTATTIEITDMIEVIESVYAEFPNYQMSDADRKFIIEIMITRMHGIEQFFKILPEAQREEYIDDCASELERRYSVQETDEQVTKLNGMLALLCRIEPTFSPSDVCMQKVVMYSLKKGAGLESLIWTDKGLTQAQCENNANRLTRAIFQQMRKTELTLEEEGWCIATLKGTVSVSTIESVDDEDIDELIAAGVSFDELRMYTPYASEYLDRINHTALVDRISEDLAHRSDDDKEKLTQKHGQAIREYMIRGTNEAPSTEWNAKEYRAIARFMGVTHVNTPACLMALNKLGIFLDDIEELVMILPYNNALTRILRLLGEGEKQGGHLETVLNVKKQGYYNSLWKLLLSIVKRRLFAAPAEIEGVLRVIHSYHAEGHIWDDESWREFEESIQQYYLHGFAVLTPNLFNYFRKHRHEPRVIHEFRGDINREMSNLAWGNFFGLSEEIIEKYDLSLADELALLAQYTRMENASTSDYEIYYERNKQSVMDKGIEAWQGEVPSTIRQLYTFKGTEVQVVYTPPLVAEEIESMQNLIQRLSGYAKACDDVLTLDIVLDDHETTKSRIVDLVIEKNRAGDRVNYSEMPDTVSLQRQYLSNWDTLLTDTFKLDSKAHIEEEAERIVAEVGADVSRLDQLLGKMGYSWMDISTAEKLFNTEKGIERAIKKGDSKTLRELFLKKWFVMIPYEQINNDVMFDAWVSRGFETFLKRIEFKMARKLSSQEALMVQKALYDAKAMYPHESLVHLRKKQASRLLSSYLMNLFSSDIEAIKMQINQFQEIVVSSEEPYYVGFFDDNLHLTGEHMVSGVCTEYYRSVQIKRGLEDGYHFGVISLKDETGRIYGSSQVQVLRVSLTDTDRVPGESQVIALTGINLSKKGLPIDGKKAVHTILQCAHDLARQCGFQGAVVVKSSGIHTNQSSTVGAYITKLVHNSILIEHSLEKTIVLSRAGTGLKASNHNWGEHNYSYSDVYVINDIPDIELMPVEINQIIGKNVLIDEREKKDIPIINSLGRIKDTGALMVEDYEALATEIEGYIEQLPTGIVQQFKETLFESGRQVQIVCDRQQQESSIRKESDVLRVTIGSDCLYGVGNYEYITLYTLLAEMIVAVMSDDYTELASSALHNENAYLKREVLKGLLNYVHYPALYHRCKKRFTWKPQEYWFEMSHAEREKAARAYKDELTGFVYRWKNLSQWNVFRSVIEDEDPYFLVSYYMRMLDMRGMLTDEYVETLFAKISEETVSGEVSLAHLRNVIVEFFFDGILRTRVHNGEERTRNDLKNFVDIRRMQQLHEVLSATEEQDVFYAAFRDVLLYLLGEHDPYVGDEIMRLLDAGIFEISDREEAVKQSIKEVLVRRLGKSAVDVLWGYAQGVPTKKNIPYFSCIDSQGTVGSNADDTRDMLYQVSGDGLLSLAGTSDWVHKLFLLSGTAVPTGRRVGLNGTQDFEALLAFNALVARQLNTFNQVMYAEFYPFDCTTTALFTGRYLSDIIGVPFVANIKTLLASDVGISCVPLIQESNDRIQLVTVIKVKDELLIIDNNANWKNVDAPITDSVRMTVEQFYAKGMRLGQEVYDSYFSLIHEKENSTVAFVREQNEELVEMTEGRGVVDYYLASQYVFFEEYMQNVGESDSAIGSVRTLIHTNKKDVAGALDFVFQNQPIEGASIEAVLGDVVVDVIDDAIPQSALLYHIILASRVLYARSQDNADQEESIKRIIREHEVNMSARTIFGFSERKKEWVLADFYWDLYEETLLGIIESGDNTKLSDYISMLSWLTFDATRWALMGNQRSECRALLGVLSLTHEIALYREKNERDFLNGTLNTIATIMKNMQSLQKQRDVLYAEEDRLAQGYLKAA